MKNIILWTVNIASIIFGLFFAVVWFNRLKLDYNAQGRYFDEMTGVVYDKDQLLVYGILTLFFMILGLLSWIITWRTTPTVKI